MPINFDFRNVVNKRGSGSEVLHSNELHVVSQEGTFVVSLQPLDVIGSGRLTVRQTPAHTGVLLTETLTLSEVISGSMKFYIDFSTRTVFVDPDLIGSYIYSTYSSSYTHIVEEEYTLKIPDVDGLCRLQLQEAPLEFPLTSTDTRKISIISDNYGPLQETKTLSEVHTTITKYYIEFAVGRIAFNPTLIGDHIQATYYGCGAIVWSEDVKELQASIKIMDVNVVDADGSNPMTGDLDMDGHSIINAAFVDTLSLSSHNHEGGSDGVVLNGELSVLGNTIISANLNNKSSGSGAVAVGNIQDSAVTNIELLSDKESLNKVSGGVLVVGGVGYETIGVNTTPGISETANILFRTQVGVSSDKFIFHDSGAGNTCGINVDASGNLNVFCLLTKKMYFRHEDYTGPANFIIDSQVGDVTVNNNINAISGKLQENGNALIPGRVGGVPGTGTKMVFYQVSSPLGWEALPVDINDFALRVVTTTGGTSTAGSISYSNFLSTATSAHYAAVHGHTGGSVISSKPNFTLTSNTDSKRDGGGDAYAGLNEPGNYWYKAWVDGEYDYRINLHKHYSNIWPSTYPAGNLIYSHLTHCKYADCIIAAKI